MPVIEPPPPGGGCEGATCCLAGTAFDAVMGACVPDYDSCVEACDGRPPGALSEGDLMSCGSFGGGEPEECHPSTFG